MESNTNPFSVDSYIVLDVPEDIAQKVMNLENIIKINLECHYLWR